MKKTKMLKKNYQFKNVLIKGKCYPGTFLVAYIKQNNLDFNLLGIGISVKVGKAVKRNRAKRLIRESYRFIEKDLKIGYSIIFLWKKRQDISNVNFKNIKEDIEKILKDAQIIEE